MILAAYGADFAKTWGGKVRDILEEHGERYFGIRIRHDARAADEWLIEGHEGGMTTCGIGGPITGRGADLLLIDDPVKNAEEALSPATRQKHWDWYASTADTRLEPGGSVALTMTPWHEDDLGGRILASEPDLWDVLRLPALAEENDPLGRKEGEALWPERYAVSFFERKRKQDPFWFDALYQCRPRPRDGGIFKVAWFDGKVVPGVPCDRVKTVRWWDKAGTAGGGDWTAGVKISKGIDGRFYVEDVIRGQWSQHERDKTNLEAAATDGFGVEVCTEQEPGSSGKDIAAQWISMMAGYVARAKPSSGDKETRARPFASQCEAGNVFLVAGAWNNEYVRELCGFPFATFDDQVDASSGAFNELAAGIPASWGPNPFSSRMGSYR